MASSLGFGASGVVHHNAQGHLTSLPLSQVSVAVLVIDVSARVTLTQTFYNPSDEPSPRAKYVFPLPASSAVCAFEMRSDDRVIHGVAKERQQAKEEHEQAAQQGKLTSLVEWATDDLFTISLGIISGQQKLVTILTYTLDLMAGDRADEIRLQLPMSIGQRYGQTPEGMGDTTMVTEKTRVRIKVNIQTQEVIQNIHSPTHSVSVTPYLTHRNQSSRRRTVVKFSSARYLSSDFVLCIKAEGLDKPRCFVERDPRNTQSTAMQLTLVPKLILPPIQKQEYIFLLDRSGSMNIECRLEIAKRTLVMLLHWLPKDGMFNIYAFDHAVEQMFPSSQQYNQRILEDAVRWVEQIEPRGGTEILPALERVFQQRNLSVRTVVFLLTDGEAYNVDETIHAVSLAVAQSPSTAKIRVFTLGIGNTASSAMCEGIARAGGGMCRMATSAEEIMPMCATLVRAGRTSLLRNITVDWGLPLPAIGSPGPVRFSGEDAMLRQVPATINTLYSGYRNVIFALINLDGFDPPEFVTLKGTSGDGAETEEVELKVPVEYVKFTDDAPQIPLIHTRAARQLINQLQESIGLTALPDDVKKASIVRLGEQYQLASRYTSFVAVEDVRTERIADRRRRVTSFPRRTQRARHQVTVPATVEAAVLGVGTFMVTAMDYASSFFTAAFEFFTEPYRVFSSSTPDPTSRILPGQYHPLTPDSVASSQRPLPPVDDNMENETDHTFTTISSLNSYSSSEWSHSDTDVRRSRVPPPDTTRSPSPYVTGRPSRGDPSNGQRGSSAPPPPMSPPEITNAVYALTNLQAFDGSFSLDANLGRILGNTILDPSVRPAQVDAQVWATALAVAFYRKHLVGQQEILEALVEKAMEWVNEVHGQSGVDFEGLVESAKILIV
ncbi:hypothetical protein BXZ70DRAFT_49953 [Cristinia sonorae]|uniref:Uncharacterized protein n=1 Tax=Cristinia sonorae TaxID=1940300 RepID=A0A8K0US04_9AGAR|nr:hypothetical protein BXZ70DRAFT_49953 [Cristinia sonorae]